jgi:hypothetical protein
MPAAQSGLGRVARHVRMLGVLWIALSALHLLRGGGRLIGARIVGFVGRGWSDDVPWGWPVGHVLPAFLSVMGLISLVLAALGFVAGWGLLERRPWGRTLAIVVAVIALFNPILGTILGIYTLCVLLIRRLWSKDHRYRIAKECRDEIVHLAAETSTVQERRGRTDVQDREIASRNLSSKRRLGHPVRRSA